jgi:hypothetical protein
MRPSESSDGLAGQVADAFAGLLGGAFPLGPLSPQQPIHGFAQYAPVTARCFPCLQGAVVHPQLGGSQGNAEQYRSLARSAKCVVQRDFRLVVAWDRSGGFL